MSEEKFDPVREFITVRDSLSRAVEQGLRNVTGTTTFPALDIYETDETIIVQTEPLVGVDIQGIEISIEKDTLTISGEATDDRDLSDGAFLLRELRFGPFSRSVRLPRPVKNAEAKARFTQQMLVITLPKRDPKAGTQIVDVIPTD